MPNRSCLIVLCLTAGLSLPSPRVWAQDAATIADVRCVVVLWKMQESPDPKVVAVATEGSLYYLGRLDGRHPKLDLEPLLIQQSAKMAVYDLRPELMRCGELMSRRGRKIANISIDMIKRGLLRPKSSR